MRPWQRTARKVCSQDGELSGVGGVGVVVVAFYEPDETGSEHGICCCEEGGAEGFDAGEGGGEFGR